MAKLTRTLSGNLNSLMHKIKDCLKTLRGIHPSFSDELRMSAEAISNPGYLADFVASSAIIDYKNKQSVLEAMTVRNRLEKLLAPHHGSDALCCKEI